MGRTKDVRGKDLDNQIDDFFAGPPSRGESFAGIARHLAGARSQLVQAPAPEVRERHLAAMMEEAKATSPSILPTPRPTIARRLRVAAMKLGAGATALSLSTAGLAYAGVDLPGRAAAQAFEVVGIELPNQVDGFGGGSVAEAVLEVIEDSEETGCEFGQAVAEAASQNRQDEPKSTEDRCLVAPNEGRQTAEERSGSKSKAGDAARGGSSTGSEKAAEGKARADENKAAVYEKSGGKGSPAEAPPSDPPSDATQPDRGGSGEDRGSGASERSLPSVPDIVDSVKEKRGGGKPDGAGR